MNAQPLRAGAAFVLGALLPVLSQLLLSMLDDLRPGAPHQWMHEPAAWAAATATGAVAVAALAGAAVTACAIAAALGGLSTIGLVIALHRLPMPLVLALWPQALALGVVLPLAAIWLAWRLRRR